VPQYQCYLFLVAIPKYEKITTLSTVALSTLLLITAAHAKTDTTAEMKHEASHNEHAKHWGYMGDVAPRHWGEYKI
jgi:carbonic anhydrase